MFALRRSSSRWVWPIAIGAILIVTLCLLLAANAVNAKPDMPQPDRTSARPTAGMPIPKLPAGVGAPAINGDCNDPSYTLGVTLTFTDQGGAIGLVHLLHDDNNLYVCLSGAKGDNNKRFGGVYLDTDNGREVVAEADDYALYANIIGGALSSFKGDGAGGYISHTLSGWTAAVGSSTGDVVEYQISKALTGGACGQPFGLSVRHQQVASPADDFGWPDGGAFNKPDTWKEVQLDQQTCDSGKIAYVYRRDTATAGNFKSLLESAGYTVQLIQQSTVPTTNFDDFDLTIVANDTGNLDQWGAVSVTSIISPNKPIIGLGEGGYAFFGRVPSPIGWPNGWHGPQDKVLDTGLVPSYYLNPNNLSGLLPGPFPIYAAPVNEVAIYLPTTPYPPNVFPIGWEPLGVRPNHAALVNDGCYHLWGYSGGPSQMNGNGQNLFLNAVAYMRSFQCPSRPTPQPNCVTLVKTAVPPSGSTVQPGDVIKYTVVYTVADSAACTAQRALLFDKLPDHTLFVPGSASDGKIPNIERTLTWDLSPLNPGTLGSKTFTVNVLDTACRQQVITNTAKLQTELGVFTSNTTTHNVNCPPVIPPNNDPPYAESEIQVYPYPLVTGAPTQFSVRVFNNSATSQTVTVTFQTSPNNFGIGIPFGTLPVPGNPRVVTIGAHGYAEVHINWTPDKSGHYCILVKIENPNYPPIYTYRNLDVAEDLKPGVTDVLTFSVANPTAATANITLTVDNTCPGWTAVVNPAVIFNAVPGTIYTATLSVTPPNPAILGTACHIDVQGWIGDRLIGGIRKLDVPPVNLPHSDPPWLEKEITTVPTPPISGTVNHVYIELNNPWPFQRVVTVTFSEAVFGAGIPFTPFATQVFTLPANSLQKYGVPWIPIPSASLHHCLLVTLQQPGFQDQTSQRNVDLVRRTPIGWNPGSVHIPFAIGNPFPFTSTLHLNGILIGLNQWMPKFVGPGGGDPPPDLGPHDMWIGELQLVPAVQQLHGPVAITDTFISGDVARADVEVSLNDQPYSGFSVEFAPPLSVYLPLIMK